MTAVRDKLIGAAEDTFGVPVVPFSADFEHPLERQQGVGPVGLGYPDRFQVVEMIQTISQIVEGGAIHIGTDRTDLAGQLEDRLVGVFFGHAMDQVYFGPDRNH